MTGSREQLEELSGLSPSSGASWDTPGEDSASGFSSAKSHVAGTGRNLQSRAVLCAPAGLGDRAGFLLVMTGVAVSAASMAT